MQTIKRYGNRKLYSTKLSSYITLTDVVELVTTNQPFEVISAKDGTDLTKATIESAVAEFALSKMDLSTLKMMLFSTKTLDNKQKESYNTTEVGDYSLAGQQ